MSLCCSKFCKIYKKIHLSFQPCVGDISNEAEVIPENFLIATPPTKRVIQFSL